MTLKKKMSWQIKCSEMVEQHEKDFDSVRDMAEEFGYSVGSIAQFLTVGYAMRVYPEIEQMTHFTSALNFVKMRKFKRNFDD
jgi:hypothetical protein